MKDINKKFTSSVIYVKDLFTDIFKMFYFIAKHTLLIIVGFTVLILIPMILFALVLPPPIDYAVTIVWVFAVIMSMTNRI